MRVRGWVVVLLASLLVAPCAAQAQQELFAEGNRLYQTGDYASALDAYLRVYDAGFESGALFYNVGNAYFKEGDHARAILFYERAARLLPSDEDVRANLRLARASTRDDVTPLPRFWLLDVVQWWVDLVPSPLLEWLVSLFWLVTGGGVVVRLLVGGEGVRRRSVRVALLTGTLAIVLGVNLGARELGLLRPEEAVIIAAEVSVRSAPSDDPNLTLFSLHEGTKVRLDRTPEGWAEVVLEDGRVGWIPEDALETI